MNKYITVICTQSNMLKVDDAIRAMAKKGYQLMRLWEPSVCVDYKTIVLLFENAYPSEVSVVYFSQDIERI